MTASSSTSAQDATASAARKRDEPFRLARPEASALGRRAKRDEHGGPRGLEARAGLLAPVERGRREQIEAGLDQIGDARRRGQRRVAHEGGGAIRDPDQQRSPREIRHAAGV